MAEGDVPPVGPPPRRSVERTTMAAAAGVGVLLLALVLLLIRGSEDPDRSRRDARGSRTPAATSLAPSATGSSAPTASARSASTRATVRTASTRAAPAPPAPGNQSPAASGSRAPSRSPARSAVPTTLAPIAPNATFANRCRYVASDSRFVATSRVANTGNTGIEVEVRAMWSQGTLEPITKTQRARVDWRQTRTVEVSVPATRDQVELFRQHTGPTPDCQVNTSIVATYGELH